MQQPWMSVVVPAYNEEKAIGVTVAALRDWLDATGRPYEVLVVDNAQHGRHRRVVRPLLDGERIRLLVNDGNRGKGYSVRRGMLETTGACASSATPTAVPAWPRWAAMVEASREAHVVVRLARRRTARRSARGQPLAAPDRRLAVHRADAGCSCASRTRDVYCGFKLWHGAAADAVFPLQTLEGWTFDAEVLALARRLGFRVTRGGHRLGRPRRIAPVDPRGAAPGRPRAPGRPAQRA